MKRVVILGLAFVALFGFLAMTSAAGDGCPSKAKDSKASQTSQTKTQAVGAKPACNATAQQAGAGKAPCSTPCPFQNSQSATATTAVNCTHGPDGKCDPNCAKQCGADGQCRMVQISIDGMTCGGCESTIAEALSTVPGVVKVQKVSHQDGVAYVCYNPTKCETAALTTAVTAKGYQAKIVPAVATTTMPATADEAEAEVKAATQKLPCGASVNAPCAATCTKAKKTSADGSH